MVQEKLVDTFSNSLHSPFQHPNILSPLHSPLTFLHDLKSKVKTAFYTSSEQLAFDVAELTRSLGGYSVVHLEAPRKNKDCKPEYRVSIRLWFNPFKLPAKRDAYGDYMPTVSKIKKIVDAKYVGKMDGQCIRVDHPERLYLTRSYVVTHNTHTCETLVAELMAEHGLREDQILDPSEILGCSPTHNAVGTLRQRLPAEATAKTIHSALGLAMKKAKLSDEQAEKLEILRGRAATDPTFSNEDQAILDRLEAIETKQLKHAKILQPMKEPEDLAMALKEFRLIILDEAFMTSREIYGLLLETFTVSIPAEIGYSPNKILCVGDAAQLAPVGEIESKVTELPVVANLDKVVRYSGPTLDYVTRIRQGGDLCFSHQDLIQSLETVEEPVFISLPESEVIAGLAEQIYHMGSENVRILSPTNRRVRELNELAQMAVSDTPDRFRTGDNLITRQPVMYESHRQYIDINGYIRGPEKEIVFTTSSLLSIREVIGEHQQTAITGTEYTIQTVKAAYHGEGTTYTIDVVAPLQIAQWETELERFGKLADTTSTKSRKPGARGQKGDAAKELWAMIGLKNWENK